MARNGFRGMPGGMNQSAMLKQAQKMQQEMLRMQEEQDLLRHCRRRHGQRHGQWQA